MLAGFELREYECEESTRTNTTLVCLRYGSSKEGHAAGKVDEEDVSSPSQFHYTGTEESAHCEGTLSTGQ